MADWKPGDVANGHILGEDLVWRPLQSSNQSPLPVLSDEERMRRLDEALFRVAQTGGRVVERSGFQAVVEYPPKQTSHVAHLLLTIFTCLLYLLVWLAIALNNRSNGPTRRTVRVDEYGQTWMLAGSSWVTI